MRLFITVLLAISLSYSANPTAPTKVRVMDSYEQLGIDTAVPSFGWQFSEDSLSFRRQRLLLSAEQMKSAFAL